MIDIKKYSLGELEVIYENNVSIDIDAENYKEMYFDKVKKNRKRDFYRKNTSIGPHKDDLKILINGIDARSYGSQGQQRTAALSLKLAEIKLIEEETNEKPILLLDDVLSELDISRQQFLISTLKDLQIFITTTEINELLNSKIDEKEYYKVINGKIERKWILYIYKIHFYIYVEENYTYKRNENALKRVEKQRRYYLLLIIQKNYARKQKKAIME